MLKNDTALQYVFLCNSPLQVLSAYEARLHFNLPAGDCVLVLVPLSQNSEALACVAKLETWAKILVMPARPSASLRKVSGLWSYLSDRGAYFKRWQRDLKTLRAQAVVFLAHTSLEDTRIIAAWLRPKSIVYLDDGTLTASNLEWLTVNGGTLSFGGSARLLNKAGNMEDFNWSLRYVRQYLMSYRRRLRAVLMSFQASYYGVVSGRSFSFKIFTVYAPKDEGCLIRNKRSYIHSLMKDKVPARGCVHFLGAPLVERRLVDRQVYVDWLLQVKSYFYGCEVIYIPHPAEGRNFVNQLVDDVGLTLTWLDMPYEIVFATSGSVPSSVASWFCSALENIAEFDVPDVKILAFQVYGLSSGNSEIKQAADGFYARHKEGVKIKVIPLS